MLFKRAMKGELPLLQAAQNIDEEIADPRLLPAPVGRLANERLGAELAKRQFLFVARAAAMLGPALEERQEALAALADVAIEAYAMDSALGRTIAADDAKTPLREALCRLYCMDARERAFDRARTALSAVAPAEMLEEMQGQLARLHRYLPMNPGEAREAVAPAVLEAAGYPLAY
jgi:hypothetical protein